MKAGKELVLEYVEAFNGGELDRLCGLFASDAQIWGVLGFGSIEQAQPVWKDLMECLQIHLKVEGIVDEKDVVAVRYVESGKAVKPFRGKPATENTYELVAMEWFEVREGKITRRWGARDSAAMAKQLGWE